MRESGGRCFVFPSIHIMVLLASYFNGMDGVGNILFIVYLLLGVRHT